MIPEIGQFALILALLAAVVQATLPLAGAKRGYAPWIALARPAAYAQLLLVLVAFGALAWSFYTLDFSVIYVVENSNSALPWFYRLTAVWGGHEGSLLLWITILCLWTGAVARFSHRLPESFVARVLAVLAIVAIGFYGFILFTSNPFARVLPALPDGQDLNPLLQDPGMIAHPPMLYTGYVGLSVPFAFAVAALMSGKLDQEWARWVRPWTTVAWAFLTFGIAIGSWWAYYELGWGGWWFWDPVENASFMPWLVGTALIHSLAVTERRGAFRSWTALLAICAFSLSLLGTFLVRSGVLISVHAFARDPARGLFILAFLGIVSGGSLILYALRAPRIAGGERMAPFSRAGFLLANNLLLTVAAAMVLLGTLYPLILSAFGLGRISVGAPYFGFMFTLLMAPIAVLQPVGPFVRWRQDNHKRLVGRLWLTAALAVALALAASLLLREWSIATVLGMLGGTWVALGTLDFLQERARRGRRRFLGLPVVPRAVLGMCLAHLGVGIFMIGAAVTESQTLEIHARMEPGTVQTVGDYRFRFEGVERVVGPNYIARIGTVDVLQDGEKVTTLHPAKRDYGNGQVMTEAGIAAGVFRDLYVSLGEPLSGDAWAVRLYYKPLVRWIWFGALLMMAGGLTAASDPRYRNAAKRAGQRAGPAASTADGYT